MKSVASWISPASLGRPFKTSANGWVNYSCPFCQDGKKDHFWVSPDGNLGTCHKCLKTVRVVRQDGDAALSEGWGGVNKLKAILAKGLNLFREDSPMQYTPLDMTALTNKYDMVGPDTAMWLVQEMVEEYCFCRHLEPIDLLRVGVQVLVPKVESDEIFALFFPIYRRGITAAAWTRHFYNTQAPKGIPWRYHSQSGVMLYDIALPTSGAVPGTTLILVEGVADAIRLNKLGWRTVALGGKHLTALGKAELIAMPNTHALIMLDRDALVQAIDLMAKVAAIKRKVGLVLMPQDGSANDPSELADATLQECLREAVR